MPMHGLANHNAELHLVVDDVPSVWHSGVIVSGKGMIAETGRPKGVAGHPQRLEARTVALDVKGSKAG